MVEILTKLIKSKNIDLFLQHIYIKIFDNILYNPTLYIYNKKRNKALLLFRRRKFKMKASKGIGIRLYLLIGFVVVFTLSLVSFSWITFKNSNEKYKNRLQVTAEYINIVDEARQAK